jgi:hypothetical protein
MHSPGLGVRGVEPAAGQRGEEPPLDLQALRRWHTRCRMRPGVHPRRQPQAHPVVQLADRARRAERVELDQDRLLQVPERALRLAFAFGVTCLTRLDLTAVMAGELDRRRVQPEPLALRHPQGAHPVRAPHLGDAADRLEEPDQALEGVLAVHRVREPPQPPAGPAQDATEAPHLAQPPTLGPVAAVREVELALLRGRRLDRHRHRRRRPKPRAA